LWQAVTTMPASQAIVEIGAYQGGSAKFVAEVLRHIGRPLPFYVCDTYEGHVVVDPELDPKHKVGVQFRSTSAERVVKYLESCDAICRGDENAGPIALAPPSERFHWLTSPRSDVIQCGPVHEGLSADPATALDNLFESVVVRSSKS
jgi:hypothetical protein